MRAPGRSLLLRRRVAPVGPSVAGDVAGLSMLPPALPAQSPASLGTPSFRNLLQGSIGLVERRSARPADTVGTRACALRFVEQR
jgi:hypothetical protein